MINKNQFNTHHGIYWVVSIGLSGFFRLLDGLQDVDKSFAKFSVDGATVGAESTGSSYISPVLRI